MLKSTTLTTCAESPSGNLTETRRSGGPANEWHQVSFTTQENFIDPCCGLQEVALISKPCASPHNKINLLFLVLRNNYTLFKALHNLTTTHYITSHHITSHHTTPHHTPHTPHHTTPHHTTPHMGNIACFQTTTPHHTTPHHTQHNTTHGKHSMFPSENVIKILHSHINHRDFKFVYCS